MRTHRSAGRIFWALMLITVGGLLLARNLGYAIPFWGPVARYWPVLIIVWGLLKLVDHYRLRRAGDKAPLFSGGEVALLIIIILAGSLITLAANFSPRVGTIFQIGDLDLWDITGNNYDYDEHYESDIPAGSSIEILNLFGNVDVRPTESDRIILDVKKTVRASNREEADRLSREFMFSITGAGSAYRIASNQDVPETETPTAERRRAFPGRQRFKSSLTIQVPKNSMLRLDNRNGKVSVRDLIGKQSIANRYGEIDVRGIDGDVEVTNRFQDVSLRDVKGAVTVSGHYGDVVAEFAEPPQKDISISLQFGDVRLRLPASAAFSIEGRTNFGDFRSEFDGLNTDRSNRERSVRGQIGAGGPQISLETRFGDIRLQKL